jgi:hypothetical protein
MVSVAVLVKVFDEEAAFPTVILALAEAVEFELWLWERSFTSVARGAFCCFPLPASSVSDTDCAAE